MSNTLLSRLLVLTLVVYLRSGMTNSEVILAAAQNPLGPFTKIKTITALGYNPQTIRAPDNISRVDSCTRCSAPETGKIIMDLQKIWYSPPAPATPPATVSMDQRPCTHGPIPPGASACMTANFTIFWVKRLQAVQKHTGCWLAIHWTAWDYGPYGNWNPAPLVHPNGSIYLLDHSGQFGWKHGEAILTADTWRGPYRLVVSDSDTARWQGTTENAEDPFMCKSCHCAGRCSRCCAGRCWEWV